MIVLPLHTTDGAFITLGTRVGSPYDPVPAEWEGVDAYLVNQICGGYPCGGLSSYIGPYPAVPYEVANVTRPGEMLQFELYGELLTAGRARLQVLEATAEGFVLRLIGFGDVVDTIFRDDIFWLAENSITRGCGNGLFCPSSFVTRGEMAAFLVRALDLTARLDDPFSDDDSSIFEADIEKLAAAGITRGCNPPENDLYCPDDPVSRGQMAAFLVRALGLTDNGGGDLFVDDDDSVFAGAIDILGTSGVTRGCNPPDNTQFCPYSFITREQMAAFLQRALG
jgi:hypothetical protein